MSVFEKLEELNQRRGQVRIEIVGFNPERVVVSAGREVASAPLDGRSYEEALHEALEGLK
jgi:hypothetical protein